MIVGNRDDKQLNISKIISDNDKKKRQSQKVQISWDERREQIIFTRLVRGGHLGFRF